MLIKISFNDNNHTLQMKTHSLEGICDLPKTTQLVRSRVGIQTQILTLLSPSLDYFLRPDTVCYRDGPKMYCLEINS